jgi:hypothetical protein
MGQTSYSPWSREHDPGGQVEVSLNSPLEPNFTSSPISNPAQDSKDLSNKDEENLKFLMQEMERLKLKIDSMQTNRENKDIASPLGSSFSTPNTTPRLPPQATPSAITHFLL